jgi:hypothetical protein
LRNTPCLNGRTHPLSTRVDNPQHELFVLIPDRDAEAQCENLGIKYVSITSKMSQAERQAKIDEFNDPTSGIMVLFINTKLGASSLNLHYNCGKAVMIEIPNAASIFFQFLGRLHRLGQLKIQDIRLLWVNCSYDQRLLWKLFDKYVPTAAGEGKFGEGAVQDFDQLQTVVADRFRIFLGMKHAPIGAHWREPPFKNKDDYYLKLAAGKIQEPKSSTKMGQQLMEEQLKNAQGKKLAIHGIGHKHTKHGICPPYLIISITINVLFS